MVEIAPQRIAAKAVPIALRIDHVQVPCLIDLLGRRHRMSCQHRERDEALVFPYHPPGEHMRPALFPRQPRGERQLRPRLIRLEGEDLRQKVIVGRRFQTGRFLAFRPLIRKAFRIVAMENPSQPARVEIRIREAPWIAGLRAARANLVPALILQAFMLALLLGYYFHPPLTELMTRLADLKLRWGFGYSALSALIAGAVIPEIMRILAFQKGRPRRLNAANLLFTVPFWCGMGMLVDAFYRTQALVFGAEASPSVVVAKVLCDQFLYSPFVATPLTCWLYDWKLDGYRLTGTRRFFTLAYARDVMVPVIFANWGVWIPVVSILYSLPSTLQIPLFGLALSLWVMLLTWISERRNSL